MADRPTGEMASSPTVWKKYVTTSHAGETGLVGEAWAAPQASTKKPAASVISPMPALAGIDGSFPRRSSHTQSEPTTGANRMMKNELTDWRLDAGMSKPRIDRSVRSRANRLSDVPACSKPDQKIATSRKSQKMTAMRRFSSLVCPPRVHTYTKYSTTMTSTE